ncbi:helix-turn-helix transcriptional regulator [Flavicella marina]|uniref:helix-turn-helix transcriptional regulator n=1 Tax=Flavicella marina TaxID=1475951 RepID=UPI0012648E35|nr:hypothetical protein [Flavicella marina]
MQNLSLLIISFFFVFQNNHAKITQNEIKQDSLSQIAESEIEKSQDLTALAYYPEAYDKLWNVLLLSDSINNPVTKYKAYKNLSILYSIFHDRKNANSSIDSMFYYAKKAKITSLQTQCNLHYAAAITYRTNNKLEKAKAQIEICNSILDSLQTPFKERLYILTEQAHQQTLAGEFLSSEKTLLEILYSISEQHNYISIIYSMLGDLYQKKNKMTLALSYYDKSLSAIAKQNSRIGLKVGLLEKSSNINYQLGNHKKAFELMTASKKLGDSLFGSQSSRNKKLFEIKDSYRKTIQENKKIKKEQELSLLKAAKDKTQIQLLFTSILVIILLISSYISYRLISKKHQLEKKLASEKSHAAIKLKEKELAFTALQIIEKDKLLSEIKIGLNNIATTQQEASIKKLKSSINVSSNTMWEEFETRFIQVNGEFYASLKNLHPDLSRNELRICSLVKLNFSTKEMASLMGISADSANKARYRLRKKLHLNRDANLVSYINSL